MNTGPVKIAIPLQGERVSGHFGHPECFSLHTVDPASRSTLDEERVTPPPHEPGLLPRWLGEHGVQVVLAGGVGPRAVALLEGQGIEVRIGVPPLTASEAVRLWLEDNLETTGNTCDHSATGHHRCRR